MSVKEFFAFAFVFVFVIVFVRSSFRVLPRIPWLDQSFECKCVFRFGFRFRTKFAFCLLELSSINGVKCIESAFLRVLHKKTATKLAMLEKISIFGADFNNPNHTDLSLGYQKTK